MSKYKTIKIDSELKLIDLYQIDAHLKKYCKEQNKGFTKHECDKCHDTGFIYKMGIITNKFCKCSHGQFQKERLTNKN